MKLKTLWASALALFVLASCSKDATPYQPHEELKTKQVYINLAAG